MYQAWLGDILSVSMLFNLTTFGYDLFVLTQDTYSSRKKYYGGKEGGSNEGSF